MKKTVFCIVILLCILAAACGDAGARPETEGSEAVTTGGSTAVPEAGSETGPQAESIDGGARFSADSRAAALSRSVGELWLLAGGQLAGVTEDALDLPGLSPDTVSIGTLSRPSLEAILACKPDFVMLTEDLSAHKTIAEQLEELGVPVLVADIENFSDYRDMMITLTDYTGRDDLYQKNCEAVSQQIDEIVKKAEKAGTEDQTYLCLRVSATKNKALKADHFACAILSDLGLKNVAEGDTALDELSLEVIVRADPDWIFLVLQGEEDEAMAAYRDAFASQEVWSSLKAVREDRIVVLPKDLFQYKPNARWAEAYEYAYEIIFQ